MKRQQKQQAKALYIADAHTNMQIAEMVGVNRRTIMLWAQQGNWQMQREAEQQMPAMLAERSQLLLHRYTSGLLRDSAKDWRCLDHRAARIIYQVASGINRLNKENDDAVRKRILSSFVHDLRKGPAI